jgi:phenylacetate-CoA ligase
MKGREIHTAAYRLLRPLWPGGRETEHYLDELKRTQWLPEDDLRDLQLKRLQSLVAHACTNVPYYRELYGRLDIHPHDIKCLEDFQALPLLTREDVQQNLKSMLAENAARRTLFLDSTGGSTGAPMQFYVDRSFYRLYVANTRRGRAWHGLGDGAKAAWFWGAQQDLPDWSWRQRVRSWAKQERFLSAFDVTEETMSRFYCMLVSWQPELFVGYPSVLSLFAQFVRGSGPGAVHPRLIETSAEQLYAPQRELLEDIFECPVANHYASRELGSMAYECERGGLHVAGDLLYLEILADGEPARPGQIGEVVGTSFSQFAMPLIRYKNGDLAVQAADPCPCGRRLPLMEEIAGRSNDCLASDHGRFIHSAFFAYLVQDMPEIDRYQVYQPDMGSLEVRLACRQPLSEAQLDSLRARIQQRFGPSTRISMRIVDRLELTPAGKHRFVISEVRPTFG